MEIQELLEQVKAGTLSIEEAKQYLRKEPFEELGYAKLDRHRKLRTGYAEVIYCEGKKGDVFVEVALQHNDSYKTCTVPVFYHDKLPHRHSSLLLSFCNFLLYCV